MSASSALILAGLANDLEIATLLLKAGADVNLEGTRQYAGVTALQMASKNGFTDMANLLKKAGATR